MIFPLITNFLKQGNLKLKFKFSQALCNIIKQSNLFLRFYCKIQTNRGIQKKIQQCQVNQKIVNKLVQNELMKAGVILKALPKTVSMQKRSSKTKCYQGYQKQKLVSHMVSITRLHVNQMGFNKCTWFQKDIKRSKFKLQGSS